MKWFKTLNILKWTMVWTAIWTMTISPVAHAQMAKKVTKSQMQTVLDQMGLNKQISMGEFYNKNKYLLPERVRKEVEPLFLANKNVLMPIFEVISSKTTSGEEIPTVRISQGGELINLQWFGESDRLLKFQNTNLSEVDVINFDDMFTRIFAGDEKFRKQVESKPLNKHSAKIPNKVFPDMTNAEWKSMTAYHRANYIVNMRTLWQDARAVLAAKSKEKIKAKPKKTSQNIFEQHPHFWALFYSPLAEAAGRTKTVVT